MVKNFLNPNLKIELKIVNNNLNVKKNIEVNNNLNILKFKDKINSLAIFAIFYIKINKFFTLNNIPLPEVVSGLCPKTII